VAAGQRQDHQSGHVVFNANEGMAAIPAGLAEEVHLSGFQQKQEAYWIQVREPVACLACGWAVSFASL